MGKPTWEARPVPHVDSAAGNIASPQAGKKKKEKTHHDVGRKRLSPPHSPGGSLHHGHVWVVSEMRRFVWWSDQEMAPLLSLPPAWRGRRGSSKFGNQKCILLLTHQKCILLLPRSLSPSPCGGGCFPHSFIVFLVQLEKKNVLWWRILLYERWIVFVGFFSPWTVSFPSCCYCSFGSFPSLSFPCVFGQ